jgi:signal transduction histidine kinase
MQALVKKPRTSKNHGWVFRGSLMILAALMLLGSCGETHPYPSVSTISGEWLAIKTELNSPTNTAAGIEKKIANFHSTLDSFSASPVGSLSQIHRPDEVESLSAIAAATERLQAAALNGEKEAVQSIILEIDSWLYQLQRIDGNLSDTIQMHYFRMFLFFIALVAGVFIWLRFLYSKLQKAEYRERQSLEFSRETVIAQEQERERIAREVHDTVAQDLVGLSLKTETMNKKEDAAERGRLCAEVVSDQKELMIRVRDICDNLIPPDFQYRRLEGALQRMCSLFEERTKIECKVIIQDNLQLGSLSLDNQLQCFRIVQECLANIEKHSQATMAPVVIRNRPVVIHNKTETELLIIVSDDGKGFQPPDRDSCHALKEQKHYGLWGLYERAALVDGILAIDSEPGEGTTITLRVPIKLTMNNEKSLEGGKCDFGSSY